MAYDEGLAQRVREYLFEVNEVEEKKMFGGLAFMIRGNMSCGITGSELMVRVGKDEYKSALKESYVREMDFTGKALKGFVYVTEDGLQSDEILGYWVDKAVNFANTLPAK